MFFVGSQNLVQDYGRKVVQTSNFDFEFGFGFGFDFAEKIEAQVHGVWFAEQKIDLCFLALYLCFVIISII